MGELVARGVAFVLAWLGYSASDTQHLEADLSDATSCGIRTDRATACIDSLSSSPYLERDGQYLGYGIEGIVTTGLRLTRQRMVNLSLSVKLSKVSTCPTTQKI
jgi:hypothetical protein